jgi:Protein of unknown function (DUF1488)
MPGLATGICMPLIRDHDQFEFERFEGVYFWMRDEADQILCKVSHEALRDRSAQDGEKASLPDTFVRHRQRIETIAGEKYDEGHRPNGLVLVLSKDLTPPPA